MGSDKRTELRREQSAEVHSAEKWLKACANFAGNISTPVDSAALAGRKGGE